MKRRSDANIFPVIVVILIVIIALTVVIHKRKPAPPKVELKVAFVIDDWGYNLYNIGMIPQIDRPITLAVLPNLRYSKRISEEARKYGQMYDVILHLPLESKSGTSQEPNTIKRSMKKERMLSILENDIESVPGIIGVSNHQGSRATENKEMMKTILGELKKRDLFFLDSRTTPVSVCRNICQKIGLRYAERDVFLDLTLKKDQVQYRYYIKKQIRELINIAKARGRAIGIGHDKKLTLEVIKESIPDIEKEGIRIAPLKDMAE